MDIENEMEDDDEIIAAFADFMTAYTQLVIDNKYCQNFLSYDVPL